MTVETVNKNSSLSCQIDLHDMEQLSQSISSVTVDPIKNAVCYIFPFLGAYSSNHLEMRYDDVAQNGMMPLAQRRAILDEIRLLKEAAGIARNVSVYSSLNHSFISHGGLFSITQPIIGIPHQHLFRPSQNYFTAEQPIDALANNIWNFTDNETRFFICRELAYVRGNDGLVRLGIKVAFIAALFFFYAMPMSWVATGAFLLITAAVYLITQRNMESQMDKEAVDILANRLGNHHLASQAALSALEKLREQNLQRHKTNGLCRYYISENGDNYLDLSHPRLSSRISSLAP